MLYATRRGGRDRTAGQAHHVSGASDFIIYSVEAEFIQRVVAEYGPCAWDFLLLDYSANRLQPRRSAP